MDAGQTKKQTIMQYRQIIYHPGRIQDDKCGVGYWEVDCDTQLVEGPLICLVVPCIVWYCAPWGSQM